MARIPRAVVRPLRPLARSVEQDASLAWSGIARQARRVPVPRLLVGLLALVVGLVFGPTPPALVAALQPAEAQAPEPPAESLATAEPEPVEAPTMRSCRCPPRSRSTRPSSAPRLPSDMALGEAIGRLLRVLVERDNLVVGNLLPGIDPADQRDQAAADGFELDPEVVTWFSLIGGINPRGEQYVAEGTLAPLFVPNSLERALEQRRGLVEWAGVPEHDDAYLPGIEAYLPLSRESMMLHCAVNQRRPATPVHRFDIVDSQAHYMRETYPSLEAMVTEWADRWEDRSYYVHPLRGAVER